MGKTPNSHIIHSLGGEYCRIVRDSEPIRLLKSPRSLSVYILITIMPKSGWVDLKILVRCWTSPTKILTHENIFDIHLLLLCLIFSAAFRGYDDLKSNKHTSISVLAMQENGNANSVNSIVRDFSGNELTLGLEKLTRSVILEKVLFSFRTTINCSKSCSAVKWLVRRHFWNIFQQFWLKLLLDTF